MPNPISPKWRQNFYHDVLLQSSDAIDVEQPANITVNMVSFDFFVIIY
ncbi:MAG: hypothetical protein H8E12_07370 [Rhodobacteraceae bacterium]|nr:hypothetical protein [Paracoccaceae bacterium]